MKNKGSKTVSLSLIALSSAFIAVCSWITLPFSVPFTLQTFAVFTVLCLLGGKKGCGAIAVYILLGAIGLPVFAGFKGGIGTLFGNTGGYIMGFLLAGLIFWLFTSAFGEKLWVWIISIILGNLTCYAFGTAWFIYFYLKNTGPVSLFSVLSWCVIPFICPDILKAVLAVYISKKLKRHIPKNVQH